MNECCCLYSKSFEFIHSLKIKASKRGFSQQCHRRTILGSLKNLSKEPVFFPLCEAHFNNLKTSVGHKGSIIK